LLTEQRLALCYCEEKAVHILPVTDGPGMTNIYKNVMG